MGIGRIWALLIMAILSISQMSAQDAVFSYNSAGNVVPNGQFVNALHEGNFANTTPYELRYSETVAFNTDYTVRSLISLLNNSLYKLYIYHPRIYSWFNALAAQILKLTQPKKK